MACSASLTAIFLFLVVKMTRLVSLLGIDSASSVFSNSALVFVNHISISSALLKISSQRPEAVLLR